MIKCSQQSILDVYCGLPDISVNTQQAMVLLQKRWKMCLGFLFGLAMLQCSKLQLSVEWLVRLRHSMMLT